MTVMEYGAEKTKAMVRGLPRAESIVVVPNQTMRRAMLRLIHDTFASEAEVNINGTLGCATIKRPDQKRQFVRVVMVREASDFEALRGQALPLFVDHSWFHMTPRPDEEMCARMEAYQRNSERYLVKA